MDLNDVIVTLKKNDVPNKTLVKITEFIENYLKDEKFLNKNILGTRSDDEVNFDVRHLSRIVVYNVDNNTINKNGDFLCIFRSLKTYLVNENVFKLINALIDYNDRHMKSIQNNLRIGFDDSMPYTPLLKNIFLNATAAVIANRIAETPEYDKYEFEIHRHENNFYVMFNIYNDANKSMSLSDLINVVGSKLVTNGLFYSILLNVTTTYKKLAIDYTYYGD